jgi:hypothetical protein
VGGGWARAERAARGACVVPRERAEQRVTWRRDVAAPEEGGVNSTQNLEEKNRKKKKKRKKERKRKKKKKRNKQKQKKKKKEKRVKSSSIYGYEMEGFVFFGERA